MISGCNLRRENGQRSQPCLGPDRRANAEVSRIIAGLVERVPPAIEAPESAADLLEAERSVSEGQRIEDVQRERAERLEA